MAGRRQAAKLPTMFANVGHPMRKGMPWRVVAVVVDAVVW